MKEAAAAGDCCSSSSSSIDSSSSPLLSISSTATSLLAKPHTDLPTDLRLGLTLSPQLESCTTRNQSSCWPPIRAHRRSQLRRATTFFVKVYMEGVPIGRKLDLLVHRDYEGLVRALRQMFGRAIFFGYGYELAPADQYFSKDVYILTYEDKEGDWMMVGDVPWEMFLTTVKKLKITRASTTIHNDQ